MGAWGAGPFENDDAADWLFQLDSAEDDSVLEIAFDELLSREVSELPEEGGAIAAAEIVAASLGRPVQKLPDDLAEWVRMFGSTLRPETTRKAIRAVEKVATESEMLDLWTESDYLADWQASIADLQKRLAT